MSEPIHVFYLEDNEGDAELLGMCIERYNYSNKLIIDIAETIDEAKELFDINKYSAALLDWNLPDGEGIEIGHFIRELSSDIPIFILSGSLTNKHFNEAQECDPTECLEKNYNKEFIERIWPHILKYATNH